MILREFRIRCDSCSMVGPRSFDYSEDVKKWAREQGWRVNNNALCPACLADDLLERNNAILKGLLREAMKEAQQ